MKTTDEMLEHEAKVAGDADAAEANSLREQVRMLTAERDSFKECVDDVEAEFKRGDWVSSGFSKEMVERAKAAESEADTLRARVAELEAHLEAASEQGREWLRERDTARDAALEEAKHALRAEAGRGEVRDGVLHGIRHAVDVVDALKAQPARRFVEAERVAEALRTMCDVCGGRGSYLPSCLWCHDSTTDHECPERKACNHEWLRPVFARLGLSMGEVKP